MLVITGRGRGFCSGGDVEEIIGELQKFETAELLEFTRMTGAVVKALRECPLPVIAAVNGVAAGAGSVIALASDFRLLAESAKFAFLFTKVGLAGADMGSAYLLPRLVGLGRATELLMLGDKVPAARASRSAWPPRWFPTPNFPRPRLGAGPPPGRRPGPGVLDDQGAADPRAGHGPRQRDRAGGDDPGAADDGEGPQGVLRGLDGRPRTPLDRPLEPGDRDRVLFQGAEVQLTLPLPHAHQHVEPGDLAAQFPLHLAVRCHAQDADLPTGARL